MPEAIAVTVPLSFFEYRAIYREPILVAWQRNGEIINAVLKALKPWNIQLGRVSAKPFPANLGEMQFTFEVIPQKVSFNLGLQAAAVSVANPAWEEAELISRIARSATEAVVTSAAAEIESQQATLSMHLTPKTGNILDITSKFGQPHIELMPGDQVEAYGFSAYRKNGFYVVDTSLQYGNSLFLRLSRSFDRTSSLEEIASALRRDQDRLLNAIALRIE